VEKLPRPTVATPETEPAHITLRDWSLCVLDERARAHLSQIREKSPPELEQGNGSKASPEALISTPEPEGACRRCGSLVLFLDESRPSPTFVCGECLATRPALAPEKRRAPTPVNWANLSSFRRSLPARVALYLRALFTTANNREARP
jgi:hypothetical protein